MHCRTAQQLITAAVTGDLAAERRETLAAHCEGCASCRDEWEALSALWSRMEGWRAPVPSADLADRFASRVAAATSGPADPRNPARRWMVAAAVIVFLAGGAGGFGLGRWTAPAAGTADSPGPAYLLLLYGETEAPGKTNAELIAEYAAWARELAGAGRLVEAGRLLDRIAWVEPGERGATITPVATVGPDAVSGFFLLQAEDISAALDLAREGPHARYGGRIAVRPIAQ